MRRNFRTIKKSTVQLTSLLDLLFVMVFLSLVQQKEVIPTKKKTIAGWDFEVEWKDDSTSWLPLKEFKETNTVEVAEYTIVNRIDKKTAFD